VFLLLFSLFLRLTDLSFFASFALTEKYAWKSSVSCDCKSKVRVVSYECCKAGLEECGFPHSKCEGVEKVAPEGADAPCSEEELVSAECPVEGLPFFLSPFITSCVVLTRFFSCFALGFVEKFEWKPSMICNCVTKAHVVSYQCCKAGLEECGLPHSKCEGVEKVAPEGADVPCTEEELVSAECPVEGLFSRPLSFFLHCTRLLTSLLLLLFFLLFFPYGNRKIRVEGFDDL
jgi:hypothetical protein